MKKYFIVLMASLMPIVSVYSQVANDAPKSSSGLINLLIIITIIVFLIVAAVWVLKRLNNNLKPINWILIVANLIVAASPFFTWYSEGVSRFGNYHAVTILDDKGIGELLIILAVLNILFALSRRLIPTIILTVLVTLLAAILIYLTCEEMVYFHNFGFGAGFFMLVAGVVLMAASYPISNAILKKKHNKVMDNIEQKY